MNLAQKSEEPEVGRQLSSSTMPLHLSGADFGTQQKQEKVAHLTYRRTKICTDY